MAKKSKRVRNDNDLSSYLAELKNKLPHNEAVENYVSTTNEVSRAGPVLIMDSGCDQSVLGDGWLVDNSTRYKDPNTPGIRAAFESDMTNMDVATAYSTFTTLSGEPLGIIRMNQALIHPVGGNESMISEDQMTRS